MDDFTKEQIESIDPEFFNEEDLEGFHEWNPDETVSLPIIDASLVSEDSVSNTESIYSAPKEEGLFYFYVYRPTLEKNKMNDSTVVLLSRVSEDIEDSYLSETFNTISTAILGIKNRFAVKQVVNLYIVNSLGKDECKDSEDSFILFEKLKNGSSLEQKLYSRFKGSSFE